MNKVCIYVMELFCIAIIIIVNRHRPIMLNFLLIILCCSAHYYAHVKELCLKFDCSIRVYQMVSECSIRVYQVYNKYGECSIRVITNVNLYSKHFLLCWHYV